MADQRTVRLIDEFFDLTRDFIARHHITYTEYSQVMQYLISLGDSGEWPLFLDAFFESWVNTETHGKGEWTPAAISGPYYKPGAPMLSEPYVLPMRADEPGEPLVFHAEVTGADGTPVAGAVLDVWHSTNDGVYTFFNPALPEEYLLRGRISVGPDGRATFRSIVPVPYEIPKGGPTGYLMNDVLGRHSWRPAHLHFTVTADGFTPLTTQLYFRGDPYLDSDSCSAVKPDLVIDLAKAEVDGEAVREGTFTFRLRPA